MHYMTSQEIRNTWLNFFKERGHAIEPSASLIPHNDPTLLWINAGVAALKKYFDGSEIPECKRITNAQKCIRTNDIDNVGKTARHHTFFEMLGNFSIGDYFRKEVIAWAFELLTSEKYFGLPADKLYMTYHPSDTETKECWMKQGVKEDHLIPLEGNFWQIGEGPCGPNTEVFFDRGEKYDPDHIGIKLLKEDIENDRYIEIWGIVFSQYNAVNGVARENYKELPHKNIDTGAGLERICCVLQETETNFETDLFYPIILKTKEISGVPYEGKNLMAFRVIADHIRSCTFALADGEVFSNEGRGYVLRRLLRRAMRYGKKIGLNEPFLYKLVATVVDIMKPYYPYLSERQATVEKIILNEEQKFLKTLTSGEQILNSMIKGKTELSGADAFKLYDTYGFPIELTREICEDNNVKVDMEEFEVCLNKQKELARASRKNIESFNKQSKDLLEFNLPSSYTYSIETIESKAIGLFKDGVKVEEITDEGDVVFETSNFYAEMGGQIADTGKIINEDNEAEVTYVGKAPNKQHLHHVKVLYGSIKLGDTFKLVVDRVKHLDIEKNHSATHLLQSALVEVLGDECKQKGSFVCDEYLRFDFSFMRKVDANELKKVERIVNEYIHQAIEEKTLVLPIEEANKIGAISLFGEKYGDEVRVVTFGDCSKEFCGGTHVRNTIEIGLFKIVYESAISSGVRRIEAVTGKKAFELLSLKENTLNESKSLVDAKTDNEIPLKISSLKDQLAELKKENEVLLNKLSLIKAESLIKEINENGFLVAYFDDMNKDALSSLNEVIKTKCESYITVLFAKGEGRYPILVSVSKDNVAKGIKAGNIVKNACQLLGGNGGGKPEQAQGSVLDISKIGELTKELLLK